MPVNKLFGGSAPIIEQALKLRLERQGLIQSNVANIATPNYRTQELPFEEVMSSVLSGQQSGLSRTDKRHLSGGSAVEGASAAYTQDQPVDLDQEMVKLSENQLMFEIAVKMMSRKFTGMKFAIEEGGK